MIKAIRVPVLILSLLSMGFILQSSPKAAAACAANTANMGSVTGSFSVPSAGTYRVWSRIKADSTTVSNNSYTLEIDGTTCNITVGDSTSIPANTWTWVDYQSGTTTNKTNVTLTAGTHSYAMYGRESGVQVDRVIFAADSSCVPTGTGDNCVNVTPPADTTKPTVSLQAPSANATLTGASASMTATASDNVGVTKVEFLLDSTLISTDTTSPYTGTLDTTKYGNGAHTVTAKAYDAAGNSNTATATVTISNTVADTTNPTVSITAPAANAMISGTSVAFNVTATDAGGIAKVEFFSDNALLGTDTSAPYTFTLNTTQASNGQHVLTAKATDSSNNSATSAAVTVTVNNAAPDTTKPSVVINTPLPGSTISGAAYNVGVTASDAVGVTKVEFRVDGTLVSTDTSSPFAYTMDTTKLTNASHTITATAYDAANNSNPATVTVTVNNTVQTALCDTNTDGKVGVQDLVTLINNYGKTIAGSLTVGDCNKDGKVNIQDLVTLIGQYGK